MIQKRIVKILILGLIAGSFVFGLFFVNAQGFPQIPKDVREQVSEKDLIEIYGFGHIQIILVSMLYAQTLLVVTLPTSPRSTLLILKT